MCDGWRNSRCPLRPPLGLSWYTAAAAVPAVLSRLPAPRLLCSCGAPREAGGRWLPHPSCSCAALSPRSAVALWAATMFSAALYSASRRSLELWAMKRVCGSLERWTGLRASCERGVSCPACLLLRGRLTFRAVSLSRAACPVPFGLRADSVTLTLSPLHWLLGRGVVSRVEAVGVTGLVDFASTAPRAAAAAAAATERARAAGTRAGRGGLFSQWSLPATVDALSLRVRRGTFARDALLCDRVSGTVAGARVEVRALPAPRLASNLWGLLPRPRARVLQVLGLRPLDVLGARSAVAAAALSWVPRWSVDVRATASERVGRRAGVDVDAEVASSVEAGLPSLQPPGSLLALPAGLCAPLVALVVHCASPLFRRLELHARCSDVRSVPPRLSWLMGD
eukprot:m51a1_g2408 hypothetical protein (396) ;mRNA; f:776870-778280